MCCVVWLRGVCDLVLALFPRVRGGDALFALHFVVLPMAGVWFVL